MFNIHESIFNMNIEENLKLMELLLPSRGVSSESLKPEQSICVDFANALRALTFEKKLSYVWFHVPNEFLPSARINYTFELKQKHMGKISGVPDYCFMSSQDCFFIEFKAGKGRLSPNQKIFESWCLAKKIPYFLCFSAQEGLTVVLEREFNQSSLRPAKNYM